MNPPNRTHLSDLRGAARLAVDATTGITRIVETMHRTIQRLPAPVGEMIPGRTRGITGLVYRSILKTTGLVGKGIETTLTPAAALLSPGESTPRRDALRSVINGVYGDYLERTDNPLAMGMSLRFGGEPVDAAGLWRLATANRKTATRDRLLVLVHGLCMNDRHWTREGHNHGQALADELGYVPVYLRYNSGLSIDRNGKAFAEHLEALVRNWPEPLRELAIVGFSMGGLVARSACRHGDEAGHVWRDRLHKLVFLGTPHNGTPLERTGQWIDYLLDLSPYSAPLSLIGKQRSAGITDLRHGSLTRDPRKAVPLPAGVACYAAAATLGTGPGLVGERLIGDGLVPVDSALGRHRDAVRSLAIPEDRQWVGYEMGHLQLLGRTDIYSQLRSWLEP